MSPIQISSNCSIGPNCPTFVIAEVGINHNGSLELAKKLIDKAKESGASAVKFQNFLADEFILDKDLSYRYLSQGKWITESQYEMFKRYELSLEMLDAIKHHADEQDIMFFSTPSSLAGLQVVKDLQVRLLKNGSDYLGNLELIEAMAQSGLPTILSTGMATVGEIEDAVQAFRKWQAGNLILLHCVSLYPAPASHVHLRKMAALQSVFGVPVGFSDHTQGHYCALAAVALGACVVEKHFTLDHQLPGPDHRFSADPKQLTQLVSGIREVEQSLGHSQMTLSQEEADNRQYKLSCMSLKPLKAGESFTQDNIGFARPGTGLAPKYKSFLKGKTVKRDLEKGQLLTLEDLI